MYRKMDIAERAAKVAEMAKQLGILEGLVDGPQAVAAAGGPTTADAAIFPILVFCKEVRHACGLTFECAFDAPQPGLRPGQPSIKAILPGCPA